MSEEGERICPLCAEEMDLTDQQLKPCKCGYEICVWCWHHIIEMAEKQDTEGRCPACRTPYDKDRIVGMSSNCERLVAETNGERKLKPQKAKVKSPADARKHLSRVRVMQRNLVYIIGLPLSLSDENILEGREFFGQYGKVLKVSRTRPPLGTQQGPSSSNSFNVYITYAKEEEAVRCIQSVHNFVLEGNQLRACFGTTKYCHAWLRNMPCSNPDCFYLHDVGSQEDSFTKDEIISAYTRSRVPQITISNSQRRLGNVLPPPADDFNNGAKASAKTASKNSSNNSEYSLTSSPSNSNLPRSPALPAAASWGSKLSHPSFTTPCSKVSKEKKEIATSSNQLSLPKDIIEKCATFGKNVTRSMDGITNHGRSSKACANSDSRTTSKLPSDLEYGSHSSAWNDDDASLPLSKVTACSLAVINPNRGSWSLERSESCVLQKAASASSSEVAFNESVLSSWDEDDPDDTLTLPKTIEGKQAMLLNDTNILAEFPKSSFIMNPEDGISHSTDRTTEPTTNSNIVENLSVHSLDEKGIVISEDGADFSYGCSREFDVLTTATGSELVKYAVPKTEKMQMSVEATSFNIRPAIKIHGKGTYKHRNSSSSGGPSYPVLQALNHDVENDRSVSLHLKERLNVIPDAHPSIETSDWMRNQWKQKSNGNTAEYSSQTRAVTVDDTVPCVAGQTTHFPYSTQSIDAEDHSRNICEGDYHNPLLPRDALSRNIRSTNASSSFAPDTGYQHQDVYHSEFDLIPNFASMPNAKNVADIRESNIISNILSMDVNPWDISSSNDFSKIICETNKQSDMVKLSRLLKGQNNKQSRFSFARIENHSNKSDSFLVEHGFSTQNTASIEFARGVENVGDSAGQYQTDDSLFFSSKTLAFPRAKVTAKTTASPGFSFPRMPPPGFSSQSRLDRMHESSSGSSISNNQQHHILGSSSDVELIDPAILAVGQKGRTHWENHREAVPQSCMAQPNTFENDRSRLLLQQDTNLQDHVINGFVGNIYLSSKDSYAFSQIISQTNDNLRRFLEISPPMNRRISNSQWDDWNDSQPINDVQVRNDLNVFENLRNGRFDINNYLAKTEEHGFLYNRAFGM